MEVQPGKNKAACDWLSYFVFTRLYYDQCEAMIKSGRFIPSGFVIMLSYLYQTVQADVVHSTFQKKMASV